MKTRKNHSESGFTLLEIIITFVVLAIVGGMMAAYFGKSITQSSIPIFRLNAAARLNEIMEKITAEYEQIPRWSPAKPYITSPIASIVIPSASRRQEPYGYQYICTIAGTSGATVDDEAPLGWPVPGTLVGAHTCSTTLPDPLCYVLDNGVRWELYALATLEVLQTKIGAEGSDYTQTFVGSDTVPVSYRVIHNRFIKFDTSNPHQEVPGALTLGDSDYGRYLKVTIGLPLTEANRTDETLTTLFVRR